MTATPSAGVVNGYLILQQAKLIFGLLVRRGAGSRGFNDVRKSKAARGSTGGLAFIPLCARMEPSGCRTVLPERFPLGRLNKH